MNIAYRPLGKRARCIMDDKASASSEDEQTVLPFPDSSPQFEKWVDCHVPKDHPPGGDLPWEVIPYLEKELYEAEEKVRQVK